MLHYQSWKQTEWKKQVTKGYTDSWNIQKEQIYRQISGLPGVGVQVESDYYGWGFPFWRKMFSNQMF